MTDENELQKALGNKVENLNFSTLSIAPDGVKGFSLHNNIDFSQPLSQETLGKFLYDKGTAVHHMLIDISYHDCVIDDLEDEGNYEKRWVGFDCKCGCKWRVGISDVLKYRAYGSEFSEVRGISEPGIIFRMFRFIIQDMKDKRNGV